MKTILLKIDETGAQRPQDQHSLYNTIKEEFATKEEAKEYLIDRYGRMPHGKNKIYVDGKNGEVKEVGFLHSWWNRDISHNSKNWHQTDWICIYEKELNPISL